MEVSRPKRKSDSHLRLDGLQRADLIAGIMMPGAAVDWLFFLDNLALDENYVAVFELGEPRIVRQANLAAVFVFDARIAVAEIPLAAIVSIDHALEPTIVRAVAVSAMDFSLDGSHDRRTRWGL